MDTPKKDQKPIFLIIIILVLVLVVVMITTYFYTMLNKNSSTISSTTSTEELIIGDDENISEKVSLSSDDTSLNGIYKVYMFDNTKYMKGEDPYVVVYRNTDRKDFGAFVLEELIKGPNNEEISNGLTPTFGTDRQLNFTGNSNCAGKDFTLAISPEKVGVVKFCKDTELLGDMSGSIVKTQIANSLKQFPTITKVQVLNKEGSCFDNFSGNSDITSCIE